MIDQECIDELADEIGIKDHVAAITARSMNGEIAFEPALRERVALLKGLEEGCRAVIDARLTLLRRQDPARDDAGRRAPTRLWFQAASTVFTGPIGAALGFHENRANRLIVAGGKLTGEVADPILGPAEAKVTALEEISARQGPHGGRYDRRRRRGQRPAEMLMLAGTGVALHAKPSVAASACRYRVDHGDLTALLYIQGYRQEEFVA